MDAGAQTWVVGFRALPPILTRIAAPGTPVHATDVHQLESTFAVIGEAAGASTISDTFAKEMSSAIDNKIISEFL